LSILIKLLKLVDAHYEQQTLNIFFIMDRNGMKILGINEDHNANAALIIDGKVVSCVAEERFSGVKNDTEYPRKAIDSILAMNKISGSEIDYVVFAGIISDPVQMKIKRVTTYSIGDYVREQREYWNPVILDGKDSNYWKRILKEKKFANPHPPGYYDYSFIETVPENNRIDAFNLVRKKTVAKHLGIHEEKVILMDHHRGHAAYAFYASPRSQLRSLIVTADGWGDGCNATASVFEDGKIREFFRTDMCHIARIYRWITLLLGMKPNEHEFKVMGLAPYAKGFIAQPAYEIFKKTLVVDGLDFKWNEKPSDMYYYFRDALEGIRFDGIAAGLQLWVEDLVSEWVNNLMKYTGAEALYFSGGLSMNIKANKVIMMLNSVKEFHVPPSGGDDSQSIGAAYALCEDLGIVPVPINDTYLGPEYTFADSKAVLEKYDMTGFSIIENPTDELLADYLAGDYVLGRCVGAMEFGARSLGNRAILCNPSKIENLKHINEKIKFRDFWMPFTPSILAERGSEYLVNPKGATANYMTIAFDSTPICREHLKAAIHPYDFTVRAQLVGPNTNEKYYSLIKAFEKKTGIGALLNTSLNLHGLPMVNTPDDALYTMFHSGLDGLILPGILIVRDK
jgi:carbamoyltransferase